MTDTLPPSLTLIDGTVAFEKHQKFVQLRRQLQEAQADYDACISVMQWVSSRGFKPAANEFENFPFGRDAAEFSSAFLRLLDAQDALSDFDCHNS